jgi:hypothetical protein
MAILVVAELELDQEPDAFFSAIKKNKLMIPLVSSLITLSFACVGGSHFYASRALRVLNESSFQSLGSRKTVPIASVSGVKRVPLAFRFLNSREFIELNKRVYFVDKNGILDSQKWHSMLHSKAM